MPAFPKNTTLLKEALKVVVVDHMVACNDINYPQKTIHQRKPMNSESLNLLYQ